MPSELPYAASTTALSAHIRQSTAGIYPSKSAAQGELTPIHVGAILTGLGVENPALQTVLHALLASCCSGRVTEQGFVAWYGALGDGNMQTRAALLFRATDVAARGWLEKRDIPRIWSELLPVRFVLGVKERARMKLRLRALERECRMHGGLGELDFVEFVEGRKGKEVEICLEFVGGLLRKGVERVRRKLGCDWESDTAGSGEASSNGEGTEKTETVESAKGKEMLRSDEAHRDKGRAAEQAYNPNLSLTDYSSLRFLAKIGEGSCAEVWKGEWLRSPVAIKRFRLDLSSAAIELASDTDHACVPLTPGMLQRFISSASMERYTTFHRELQLMAWLRHPNLVMYLSACGDPKTPLCIVSELFEGGSLHDCLHGGEEEASHSVRKAVTIALCIARAMNYLHSCDPPVMHRDLKASNVLVKQMSSNAELHAAVCDFGLCRLFEDDPRPSDLPASPAPSIPIGTAAYMAPDVMNGAKFHTKDDVYSFGVLLWEIFSAKIPFAGLQPVQIMFSVTCEDLRPSLEALANAPSQIANLVQRCWARERASRPDFTEIISVLHDVKVTTYDVPHFPEDTHPKVRLVC